MGSTFHTPVLLNEVVVNLLTALDGVYVDATIGGGGHADAILQRLSPTGRLVGFDRDEDAVTFAERRLHRFLPNVVVIRENFVNMRRVLEERGIDAIDGVFLDLGVSSFQIDQPGKGFSFQRDEPLDMRMDKRQKLTAASFLNTIDEKELSGILREYGEELHARRIARFMTRERMRHPIETTGLLAAVVRRAIGGRYEKKSLSRVFQALRIAVNDELSNLRHTLRETVDLLKSGGRAVVISYHSLEDRIVKEFFKAEATVVSSRYDMRSHEALPAPRLRIITKKPITPSEQEIASNNRARSAKMRVAERL